MIAFLIPLDTDIIIWIIMKLYVMLTMWKMNIILYLYVRLLLKKYIAAYYYRNPSAFKFCELLKTDKKNILYKLSKYLYEAFLLRKSLL